MDSRWALARKVVTRGPQALFRSLCSLAMQTARLVRAGVLWRGTLIVFVVPREQFISGGMLSIYNLYRMSLQMTEVHHGSVIMCFLPGRTPRRWRNAVIDRSITICPLRFALRASLRARKLLIHVPEYLLPEFAEEGGLEELRKLSGRRQVRLNILNQNVTLMPSGSVIEKLRAAVPGVTCTCAHPSYSTLEYQQLLGIPVHHLPAWIYPREPVVTAYEGKENIFLVSPDPSEWREPVLSLIRRELPEFRIQVVSNMPFEEYLKLGQKAKFSLTFGEGLDDYLLSTFLRGGIGFAVYNSEFFTTQFQDVRTVYSDWETLMRQLVADVRYLDRKNVYEQTNAPVRAELKAIWSSEKTAHHLRAYYEGHFELYASSPAKSGTR